MAAKKLMQELLELGLKNEKTGLVLLDNILADALDEERMATPAELAGIKDILSARKRPCLKIVINND